MVDKILLNLEILKDIFLINLLRGTLNSGTTNVVGDRKVACLSLCLIFINDYL